MTAVFIAGSMNIKNLDAKVKERIATVVAQGLDVIVGDADGADTSIQTLLSNLEGARATVYCSGPTPRNNVGDWPVHTVETKHTPGTRQFFTAKDLVMARSADYGLMIWDAKSTGTLSNVLELLTLKRKSVVFVNKEKLFRNIATVEDLERLITSMSDHAKHKADEKIGLLHRIELLKHEQGKMFA